MTTEQILVWVTIGAIGMIAFMVFMYGMARAKYYDECSRNAFLNANNKALDARLKHSEYIIDERESELYDKNQERKQLSVIIKELTAELTAEIEARKETSELLLKAGNELNQLNRLVQKRGKDGRYIGKA